MEQPVYSQRSYDQSFEDLLSESEKSISQLADDGFRISESCRFSAFLKELRQFIDSGYGNLDNDYDIAFLAGAIRDFAELRAIVRSYKIRSAARNEIQEMLGGARFPSEDSLTRSRDLQFQLYLASIMDLSGFPVLIDEPDFRFDYKGFIYSVAAKRINSPQKIHARLSEGKKQVRKADLQGFIAFSLDRIVWDQMGYDSYILTGNPDNLYSAGQNTLHHLLKTKVKKAAWENRDPMVIGHIASLTIPAIIPNLRSLGMSSTQLFIPSFDLDQENPMYGHIREIPQQINWP
jgi:hypothetical protein